MRRVYDMSDRAGLPAELKEFLGSRFWVGGQLLKGAVTADAGAIIVEEVAWLGEPRPSFYRLHCRHGLSEDFETWGQVESYCWTRWGLTLCDHYENTKIMDVEV